MKTKTRLCLILAIFMALLPAAASADDWPTWSGPNRDLTTLGNGVFERPTFGLERLWSKPLGSGYSGILVVGERLVTAFSDGESDFVVALAADSGEELWRYRIGEVFIDPRGPFVGPLATPAIHAGVVYALGGGGELFALRLADGHEIWRRHAVDELGAEMPRSGFVSAPTLVAGVLVFETGGGDGHSISGLDPKNGELLWSTGDDVVTYQSPVALSIDGEEQVFAITNRYFLGLVPRTGEVLWQHEHQSKSGFIQTQPVLVGEAGVVLTDREGSALYRVVKSAKGYDVEEAWRSRALNGYSAGPVLYDGHIYGFSSERFLTCVDATSGEVVWKSRPPGIGALVLVDRHLVIVLRTGEVVVAEATPHGYREKARCEALGRHFPWTRPSFAAGRVYVRKPDEIAAVRVTDEAPAMAVIEEEEAIPSEELRGMIGELVRLVEAQAAAEDKARVIDEFMAAHREVPILEGDDLVHFVFRGAVDDLVLIGNMGSWPMHRIDGTDFFFRSRTLEPEGRFGYVYGVFDEQRLDPLNSRRSDLDCLRDHGECSLVTTRSWQEAAHLRQPEGARGRIETFNWKSEIVGNERQVQVYLPAGYDETEQRYPLLLFYNGTEALEWGLMDRTLDNLIGNSVAPLIVAFVPRDDFFESRSGAPQFIQALEEELLATLDRSYRTRARPEDRAMMGTDIAGWFAYKVVIQRPDLFLKAATQSPKEVSAALTAPLLKLIESRDKVDDYDFVIEWTGHESQPRDGWTHGRILAEALTEKGYEPVSHEIPGGLGWGTWRQTTGRILETLFPLEPKP